MKKRKIHVLHEFGIALVPLGGRNGAGKVAIIDAEDADLVGMYNWCLNRGTSGLQYAVSHHHTRRNGRSALVKLHHLILAPPDGMVIDHINHNTLDNRRSNLRAVTQAQNLHNSDRKIRSSGGYVGVYTSPTKGKWYSVICVEGRNRRLGTFDSPEAACRAYNEAVAELRDDLAFRNVIP